MPWSDKSADHLVWVDYPVVVLNKAAPGAHVGAQSSGFDVGVHGPTGRLRLSA